MLDLFIPFQAMMLDLQKCYQVDDSPPLESISEGKLYAGKFRDDWYRYATYHVVT